MSKVHRVALESLGYSSNACPDTENNVSWTWICIVRGSCLTCVISLIFARILFRFSSGCCLREKPLDMKVVFECARTHDKRLVECLVYKVGFHAPNCMLHQSYSFMQHGPPESPHQQALASYSGTVQCLSKLGIASLPRFETAMSTSQWPYRFVL
jgi:hypothetical protein